MTTLKVKGCYHFCNHPLTWLWNGVRKLWSCLCWRGFLASARMVILVTKPHEEVTALLGRHAEHSSEPLILLYSTHGLLSHFPTFPISPKSCFATLLASVGKHCWWYLYSGCKGLSLYRFTVENKEKTKCEANGGRGICLRLGFCHDVKTHGFRV